MQMEKLGSKSDVVLELSEAGVDQIRIYADVPEERESGLRLLIRVGPELRALESALRSRKEQKATA